MKPYDQLTITDDFIFCKVISNHDLCRQMVETLLDIEIDRIEFITNQYPIQPALNKRGIRMDIYVKDSNRIFDIEIQTTNKYDLEKRTRYYQALMDIDQLEHSANVKELKECFIIFICTFDPFKEGALIYTVVQSFKERPGLFYNDSTHKVYDNLTSEELNQRDSKLGNFLRYLNTAVPTDNFTGIVESAVIEAKCNTSRRKEYMTLDMIIEEEKIKVHDKAKLKTAINFIKSFNLPIEAVAEKCGIDIETLQKALQEQTS